ncbi:hypothetical protein M8C21_016170 [Ambrosia artemisiifolia]|uniref:PGG domain-containing protein n=1 Tax=Ambrosia artemisiifolia TaxID=4212 RepID=A0AAD5GED1_AMBAR|nr:hypothetical protein M8C21_016170 [Ambrosia artemisiifolia]
MVCLLDSRSLSGIVDAEFVGPRDSDIETMIRYDSLVKGWIFGSISEDVLVEVFNLGSAKAVWEKLKSICDPNMCLKEDTNPNIYVTKPDAEDLDVTVESNTTEEGADSVEISVGIWSKVDKQHGIENNKTNLFELTIKGNWSKVKSVLKNDKGLATEEISSDGSTILHIAVGNGHNDFVKKLLSYLNDDQVLIKRDSDGSTALHVAAIVGNKDAADLLVKKNKKLLRIRDSNGNEPLHKAYKNMHLDTIGYLLNAGMDGVKPELQCTALHGNQIGVDTLVNAISANKYGLALELVQNFPSFASESDEVLLALANTFPCELDSAETLIYPSLDIIWEKMLSTALLSLLFFIHVPHQLFDYLFYGNKKFDLNIPSLLVTVVLCPVPSMVATAISLISLLPLMACFPFVLLYFFWWNCAKSLVAPIKQIENKKNEWDKAKKVLQLVCDEIDKLDHYSTHHPYYTRPILEAARQNAYKVVDEILYRSPKAIQSTDESGHDIILLAILHRSEKIYNIIYDIGEHMNHYRTIVDSSNNNILHLVGRLAPLNVLSQRTGAALQLQRELQWFEEVKKLVFPTYTTQKNSSQKTPHMVFTMEHKNLVKEGELWMKTTAESCSITAALITTIVFAAAINVPGGSHQENGTPLFKAKSAFIIFAIADAISLFASSTALLVFLSILTTRFAEKDFLVSLPRRLFIGLFSLLLSTIAMMVAFSATLFLVFCEENPWMLVPISGLALIPIVFFVTQHIPLMLDLFRSTHLQMFGKHRKSVLTRFHPDNMGLRVEFA